MISSSSLARAVLSIASGLALALAFPKIDLSLFAWVAFVPLFYSIDGESLWRVLGWAWLAGFSFFVGSMYWIVIPLHDFADMRMSIAILPMLLLAGILAIYSAIAIWAGEFFARRLRIPMVVTMPITWTAVEWVRTYFPIGFPWNLLGYAAYTHLTLIQFAEFTGVYGISALIIFFNAVVYVVLFQRGRPQRQALSLISLMVVMVILFGFGKYRLQQLKSATPQGSLRVAMVQGNIPQSIKWQSWPESFKVYQGETVEAAKHGADLIVWPEAAATFYFQPDDQYPAEFIGDAGYRADLLKLATTVGDPILFGAPALSVRDGHWGQFNRANLISAHGDLVAHYDKINLVPFGEYVPGRKVFGFFVNRVVEGMGDMFPGTEQTLFPIKGAKLGALICYESVFPNLTRREVNAGAEVLVNITNDAWFGESSAPFQALAMASMRSVETKAPMIRTANTGISTIIKPSGEITARTAIFTRDMEIEDVPWRPVRTVYTIVGDLFSQICVVLTLIALFAAWLFPRKPNQLEAVVQQIIAANGTGKRREAS
ncbi:MAG: apolipoprotein N-acyltransferase [Candidatus Binataceae bacterium]